MKLSRHILTVICRLIMQLTAAYDLCHSSKSFFLEALAFSAFLLLLLNAGARNLNPDRQAEIRPVS